MTAWRRPTIGCSESLGIPRRAGGGLADLPESVVSAAQAPRLDDWRSNLQNQPAGEQAEVQRLSASLSKLQVRSAEYTGFRALVSTLLCAAHERASALAAEDAPPPPAGALHVSRRRFQVCASPPVLHCQVNVQVHAAPAPAAAGLAVAGAAPAVLRAVAPAGNAPAEEERGALPSPWPPPAVGTRRRQRARAALACASSPRAWRSGALPCEEQADSADPS